MSDKPTFKEYLLFNKRNIIKSSDGSYYTPVNKKKAKYIYGGMLIVLSIVMIVLREFIIYPRPYWPSRNDDFTLGMVAVFGLSHCLAYLFTRYERIAESSEDYEYASGLNFSRKPVVVKLIFFGVVFIFLMLQSTGMAYVRYWISGGNTRVMKTSIEFRGSNDSSLSTVDDFDVSDSVIRISALPSDTSAFISIDTSGSPEPLQLSLHGIKDDMLVYPDYHSRWFWEPDYFVQCGRIFDAQIHDGSVLTLTCGDLVHEWVIDVADKEAS